MRILLQSEIRVLIGLQHNWIVSKWYSPLHFKVGASDWPQMASDWLLLTRTILPKFRREDRNKYRVRGRGRPEEKLKLNITLSNESCVDCHSSQPNNVWCDTKCFSNRYEITRYPATATTTQQHPILHTSHRIINHQQRKYYEIKFHSW